MNVSLLTQAAIAVGVAFGVMPARKIALKAVVVPEGVMFGMRSQSGAVLTIATAN